MVKALGAMQTRASGRRNICRQPGSILPPPWGGSAPCPYPARAVLVGDASWPLIPDVHAKDSCDCLSEPACVPDVLCHAVWATSK